MGELTMIIEQQNKKIDALTLSVHQLSVLVMKDKVNSTWVDEKVAAAMIGLHPETFRRKVKEGNATQKEPWSIIQYRNTNGRNWQYSRKSLIRFQEYTSSDDMGYFRSRLKVS